MFNTAYITPHFVWKEANFSSLASRYNIDNTIPENIRPVIINTANNMEKVRALINSPIQVSSWYRCLELNRKLKSKDSSQHVKGEAVDFTAFSFGNPVDICKKILQNKSYISFDQLILEHDWVHISFNYDPSIKPRGQVLSSLKSGGYSEGLTTDTGISLVGPWRPK